jgi:hypothetical protein
LPTVLPEEKYSTEDGLAPLGNVSSLDSVQCSVVSIQLSDNVQYFPWETQCRVGLGVLVLDVLYGCTQMMRIP